MYLSYNKLFSVPVKLYPPLQLNTSKYNYFSILQICFIIYCYVIYYQIFVFLISLLAYNDQYFLEREKSILQIWRVGKT